MQDITKAIEQAKANGERSAKYEAFEEKFRPKLTTDDCFTPPAVYNAIRDWAVAEYGWQGRPIIRPFYPGGDYENEEYPADCVVIDNPPFSILSRVVNFFTARGIDYFLFVPALTLFGVRAAKSRVAAYCDIVYDNGARIKTSFVASQGPTIRSAPRLYAAVKAAQVKTTKQMPKYKYPDCVLTSATVGRWSELGVEYAADDCVFVRKIDAQNEKTIYGGGYLVPPQAAQQAAQQAEKKAAQRVKPCILWQLSERENEIIRRLEYAE